MEDEQSSTLFSQYLKKKPHDEQVRLELAEAFRLSNNSEKAIENYKLLLGSKDTEIAKNSTLRLGKLYLDLKRYKESLACFIAAKKAGHGNFNELCDSALRSGNPALALKFAEEQINGGSIVDGRLHRAQVNRWKPDESRLEFAGGNDDVLSAVDGFLYRAPIAGSAC